MSLLRYPGGKNKIKSLLIKEIHSLPSGGGLQYREPFLGGGSIAIAMMQSGVSSMWVNDRDPGMSALWTSVIRKPDELCAKIKSFSPSVDSFYAMRDMLKGLTEEVPEESTVEVGFAKLALHQTSYSGLGVMSGSPLGGVEQKSQYKIDCRWYPKTLCKKIETYSSMFSKVELHENKCTCLDFDSVLSGGIYLSYVDPPYYHKGNELYQFGLSNYDHLRLSKSLRAAEGPWLVSYDDCPEIRDLYSWACVKSLDVPYSINASRDKETGKKGYSSKGELFITRCE